MKKRLVLVGFLLLALIFLFIDFKKLFEALAGTDLVLLAVSVLLGVPAVFCRSSKWRLMLKNQGYNFSVLQSFRYYFIGIGIGSFTPGRIGDFLKALFVNKKISSLAVSFSSVLVDRVIDLSVLVLLGVLSSLAFIYFFGVTIISYPLIAVMLAGMLFGFYLLFNKRLLKKFLKPFYNILVPEKFKEKLGRGFDAFIGAVQGLLRDPLRLAEYSFLSLLSWILGAGAYYALALALGLTLDFVFVFMVMSLSTLVLLLPLSVSGVGTRDALMIALFSLQGIPAETAVAFSFLVLFCSVVNALVGLSLVSFEEFNVRELVRELEQA